MTTWPLVQFAFHLVSFLFIAFVASMFVLPFVTLSFVLSSLVVGLSFSSRTSFGIGMFFYDSFVMILQVQLRSMVDHLPSYSTGQKPVEVKAIPQQTEVPLQQLAPSQTLGSTIPLQSIDESHSTS
ncbi:unnamed protein product [Kluyveromyces dobzhanskii CBS 2104]|uniref:Outer spore wall protein 5 n=1 Tax=Kluyveromyces dobzhanskii CBS 2104 TaxID=1427455 RepID=A0A0A8L9A6_9SACH|nr:unnamed protein product [Kluyveromyces dobzhanskii CBS 2104]